MSKEQDAPASARMLSMDMGAFVADCYSGESAPCRLACPLNLDIPEFIAKIKRGNFKSAYNLLRDYVVFPRISCLICGEPCFNVCARKAADAAVNLKKLEQATAEFSDSQAPVKYNAPKKNQNIAIVGAGLCGLSCAIRLGSRGYGVVVFEKSVRKGGRLWELMPGGEFMEEIELQTRHIEYEFRPGAFVAGLDELRGFDAVLLACGPGGNDLGLLRDMNRESLGSSEPGIFIAGGLIGSSPVESIENGVRASQSIESYLKIGRMHEMTGISIKKPSRLQINPAIFKPAARPDTDVYTREQALLEAAACPPCDCSDCVNACDFMTYYNKQPKNIVNNVRVRLNPVEGLQGSKGTRMINSCNPCGLCADVCSENIDMGEFLLEARSLLHREGTLPPVFHDFWMRDMYHAQSEKACLSSCAPGLEQSEYLFFPGCQLGASNPACVEKAYEYLLEKLPATGLLVGCCGAPAEWAGDTGAMEEITRDIRKAWDGMGRPEVIFACPSCEKMFAKRLPQIKQVSLYEVVIRYGLPENADLGNETVSVFDPCSSRYDPRMQDSVRELASMTGRALEELPAAGREAVCCGFGGHIYPANTELAEKIAMNRVGLGPRPFVTYCVNCRDIFSKSGKECSHILDLVFCAGGYDRPVPSLSMKRENRETLKKNLLRHVWGQGAEQDINMKTNMEIVFSARLEEKLDRLLLLEDDIRETIDYCEKNGAALLDPETGRYFGHLRVGVVTCWVEYRKEGGAYIVSNAYSHRMRIEGE